jgi:hypothetical protein
MANLIRSAKSSNDWTLYDLDSFNIRLVYQEALEFFGVQVFPDPAIDPELLDNLEADAMQQDQNAELVTLLDMAMMQSLGESAVDDFTVELFKIMGYVHRNRVARMRKDVNLLVCGNGNTRRQTSASWIATKMIFSSSSRRISGLRIVRSSMLVPSLLLNLWRRLWRTMPIGMPLVSLHWR